MCTPLGLSLLLKCLEVENDHSLPCSITIQNYPTLSVVMAKCLIKHRNNATLYFRHTRSCLSNIFSVGINYTAMVCKLQGFK
jgi:hypothetical protein